jgi:hypothetical protein
MYVWVHDGTYNAGVDAFLGADGWIAISAPNFQRSDGPDINVWSRDFISGSSYAITTTGLMVGGVVANGCKAVDWVVLYSKGSLATVSKDKDGFNALARQSAQGIIRFQCTNCASTHRDIYYRRKKGAQSFDYWQGLMVTWRGDQGFHTDFDLYSTFTDAKTDKNPWTACNGNDNNIGFPRDCGPNGYVGSQWISLSRGGQANYKFSSISDEIHNWIVDGVANSDTNSEGSCDGYNHAAGVYTCSGTSKYIIGSNAHFGTSDFTVKSAFKLSQLAGTAVTFVFRAGNTEMRLGLDGGGSHQFFTEGGSFGGTQHRGATGLRTGEFFTIKLVRSNGFLKVYMDDEETSLTSGKEGLELKDDISDVGWRPWRNTIEIKSLTGGPSSLEADPNCDTSTYTDERRYLPIDLPGHGRTVASSEACRQRCVSLPECYYFNSFTDDGCHVSGKGSQLKLIWESWENWARTRAAGPVRCEEAVQWYISEGWAGSCDTVCNGRGGTCSQEALNN